uniref:Thiamine transporter SLC35F3 n=1 Tax=Diabrotica virgifera virgifera TaxID=50390 RepID=A0A6P7FMG9_DIAVI
MTRDGDIPTIFNPRGRNRAPSVVVTEEGVANGPFAHADSVSSQQESQGAGELLSPAPPCGIAGKLKSCSTSLCSKSARKIYFGIWVTVCVTASWVGATHCIKYLYLRRPKDTDVDADPVLIPHDTSGINMTLVQTIYTTSYQAPFFTTWFVTNWTMLFFPLYFLCRLSNRRCESISDILSESIRDFRDKGFTADGDKAYCRRLNGNNFYRGKLNGGKMHQDGDKAYCRRLNGSNFYIGKLNGGKEKRDWLIYDASAKAGILIRYIFFFFQIMAVIICDTGVALLAYMDGITGSPTLGGVVLATSAAAGSAVYKVLFKKVIGDATYGQVALFFSLIGMLNAAFLWPLCLGLFLMGVETLHWDMLPWPALLTSSVLSLVANLLGNFSVALTYDLFITLGLITAVPVSAALDVVLYGASFEGMKLAGMILIGVGFFLVMFPDNWPDYITRLLRNIIMLSHSARKFYGRKMRHGSFLTGHYYPNATYDKLYDNTGWSRRSRHGSNGPRNHVVDYRTGYIRSHLRSPSGRVR